MGKGTDGGRMAAVVGETARESKKEGERRNREKMKRASVVSTFLFRGF